MKTTIIYWSGTGNTEAIATMLKNNLKDKQIEVELVNVSDANPEHITDSDIIILGCPAMGDEVLEEYEFQPYYDSIKELLNGKTVGIFGSYGWGEGQWMEDWKEELLTLGTNFKAEPLMINYAPTSQDLSLIQTFIEDLIQQ